MFASRIHGPRVTRSHPRFLRELQNRQNGILPRLLSNDCFSPWVLVCVRFHVRPLLRVKSLFPPPRGIPKIKPRWLSKSQMFWGSSSQMSRTLGWEPDLGLRTLTPVGEAPVCGSSTLGYLSHCGVCVSPWFLFYVFGWRRSFLVGSGLFHGYGFSADSCDLVFS